MGGFLRPCVSAIGIEGSRFPDAMEEKLDGILDLFLPLQIKRRSRIWLLPNTDAHGLPFREAEYIFICLIVTDKNGPDYRRWTMRADAACLFSPCPGGRIFTENLPEIT
jgi:hypothetical protein